MAYKFPHAGVLRPPSASLLCWNLVDPAWISSPALRRRFCPSSPSLILARSGPPIRISHNSRAIFPSSDDAFHPSTCRAPLPSSGTRGPTLTPRPIAWEGNGPRPAVPSTRRDSLRRPDNVHPRHGSARRLKNDLTTRVTRHTLPCPYAAPSRRRHSSATALFATEQLARAASFSSAQRHLLARSTARYQHLQRSKGFWKPSRSRADSPLTRSEGSSPVTRSYRSAK